MKRIILLATITLFGVATTNAQTAKKATKKAATTVVETPKVEGAGMVFENEILDYGTIAQNSDGKREFVLVNNGNKPLTITNTQGSCGCTVPTKPDGAIAPGAKAVIGVKYDTARVGPFTKTVTVTSNAVGTSFTPVTTPSTIPGAAPIPTGQSTKTITIKGTVLADPATPAADTPAPTKS